MGREGVRIYLEHKLEIRARVCRHRALATRTRPREERGVTTRALLVGIGLLLWAAGAAWWGWARRIHDPALALRRKQALFAGAMGVPFLIAGLFFTASSYPDDVVARVSTPVASATFPTTTPAATPAIEPPPLSPASRDEAVKAAQYAAVQRYPALGVAGTPFNRAYVSAVRRLERTDAAYFENVEWPLKLADEIDAQLQATPEPAPAATPFPTRVEGGFHRD
jgi:hypothetical protein